MKTNRLMLCCLMVVFAGCVPIFSLHPLFKGGDVVFDEKLVGTWVQDVNDPNGVWEFSRYNATDAKGLLERLGDDITKFYHLSIVGDEDGKGLRAASSCAACLVKVGDRLFLDVFPDRFPSGERDAEDVQETKFPWNVFFFQPIHTFFRVDSIGEKLVMRMTDDDGFKDLIKAAPNAVKHEIVDDRLILTASPEELQAFVTKYAGDERLFASDLTLSRKAK